jgi:very-short-patch-repair endonuclease
VLSHSAAAAHLGLVPHRGGKIEVSVIAPADPQADDLVVHRRKSLDSMLHRGIPVTSPEDTVIDMAPRLSRDGLEAMISQADVLGLTTPEQLWKAVEAKSHRPGVAIVRDTLDPHLFRLTRSKLERLFLPICERAGLPRPLTRQIVDGYEVDFYWPDIGLVIETDGGTFHRSPIQQTKDRKRDQAHARAGLYCLRFTHHQIAHEPHDVEETLAICAARAG